MSCKCQKVIVEDIIDRLRNLASELDAEQQFEAVNLLDRVIVEIAEKHLGEYKLKIDTAW